MSAARHRPTILRDWRRYQAWTEVLRLIDRAQGIHSLGGETTLAQRTELTAAWAAARELDTAPAVERDG
jgi:hypothetical protein